MSGKKSFIVYAEDIKEVVDELNDAQVAQLFRAMINYQLTGEDPKLSGILKFAFIPIRQDMDRNDEKYEAKCERNRQNAKKRWEKEGKRTHANGCETEVSHAMDADNDNDKDKDNDNDRENDNDNESAGTDVWALSLSVLSFLNRKANANFRTDDAASVRLISDLAHKGYSEEQMKDVIDRKCDEWLGDPKMEHYLRPSTLFKPDNFVKYLNAPDTARRQKQEQDAEDARAMAERIRRIDEQAEAEMERMKAHHEQFMKENGLWTT